MNRFLCAGAAVLWAVCASELASAQATSSSNGLAATILLTKEPEEFVRQWTKQSDKNGVEAARKVKAGEYVAALVLVRGCRAGGESCGVFVDYELVAPDGSVRYRVPDRNGTAQPGARPRPYQLSHAIVRFQFKKEDPPGTYTIRAAVRDPARGSVVRLSERFEVAR